MRRLVEEKGLTVICVLHDMNQALRFADSAVPIRPGRVTSAGPVGHVLRECPIGDTSGVEARVHRGKDRSFVEIIG